MDHLSKLPEMCATTLPSTGEPIIIKRGEDGYYPMPDGRSIDEINEAFEAKLNHVRAMEAGSLFGWHVPGADPDRWNEDGSYKRGDC